MKSKEKIISVLLPLDITFLIIAFFYNSIVFLIVNVILLGSYWIINRYSEKFETIGNAMWAFKKLNNVLEDLDKDG